jgi:hypothetical protein
MGGISPVSPLASECGSQDWGRRLAGSKQLSACMADQALCHKDVMLC